MRPAQLAHQTGAQFRSGLLTAAPNHPAVVRQGIYRHTDERRRCGKLVKSRPSLGRLLPQGKVSRKMSWAAQLPERCGNAGAVETVENQTTVFHRFHRPLEIARRAISTFPQRRRRLPLFPTKTPTTREPWKSGNPKRRDSHFPTTPRLSQRTPGAARFPPSLTLFRQALYPITEATSKVAAARSLPDLRVSGAPRDWKCRTSAKKLLPKPWSVGYKGGCPEFRPLAGFEVTLNGRFWGDPRGGAHAWYGRGALAA